MDAYELASLEPKHVGYFFGIDFVIVISSILRINFVKIYTDSEVIISITLLFCRMLSFVKIFH